jgi:hypothetical protein
LIGILTVVGSVTVAGTVTMPGGAVFPAMGAVAAGAVAACATGVSGRRNSTQTNTSMFTPSSSASPAAHSGNLRRGCATLTSNSAGEA